VAPTPDGDDDLPYLAEADVWYTAAVDSGSPWQFEAEGRTTTAAAASGGGRAPRHGVQGGLSRAFGNGPGHQVAARPSTEGQICEPAW
jgi:hypothetical protein